MIELQWSDALSLNLPPMDETHREFVSLLGTVAQASDDALVDAWKSLIDHTDLHFAQEDVWMRQTRFASGNCHSTQHLVVLNVMREGLVQGRAGRLDVIRYMAHELAVWFPQHAQSMDAALGLHLRSVGFDFATGDATQPARLPASEITGRQVFLA
ncbi:MAG: hemerythrin domain-containing protein [Betaproteobacteria bacterium]